MMHDDLPMTPRLWFVAILAVCASLPAYAQPAPVRTAVQADDLFKIKLPRRPQLSPDGRMVAYLLENADAQTDALVRRLHLLDPVTRADRELPVPGDVQSMVWRSNGALLVFSTNADPARPMSVLDLDTRSSAVRQIGALPVFPASVALSRDGTRLAFFMTVADPRQRVAMPAMPPGASWAPPARFTDRMVWRTDGIGEVDGDDQLFVMDLATGTTTQLTHGSMPGGIYPSGIDWSSDDRRILFSSNPRAGWEKEQFNSDLYAIDVASRTMMQLTTRIGPDFDPKVSPDGQWIAWRGFDDAAKPFSGVIALYVMRADGTGIRKLADVGQAIGAHDWDATSQGLYISFVREGVQQFVHVDLKGRKRAIGADIAPAGSIYVEPYLSGEGDMHAGRSGVVAVEAQMDDPGRIVLFDRKGRRTVLAQPNVAWLATVALGRVRRLDYAASDGTPLQAWLLLPTDYDAAKSYPLVLDIHGGPDLAYGPQFSFRFQRYAATGYAVLLPNYRGSAGADMHYYDKPWQFPVPEFDDLMTGIDAAMKTVSIDSKRLFVTGLSAGGILTAWTVGKTDRFAAAAVQSPIINWISHSLTQDLYSSYVERSFTKMPWEDPMAYWRRSPLSLVGNVTTPTLVIQGERDSRTPSGEGIQFYQALKLRGVPAGLLLLPDSFHIPTRPSQWIEEQQYILDWFARHQSR